MTSSAVCWPRVNSRRDIALYLDYIQIDLRVRLFWSFLFSNERKQNIGPLGETKKRALQYQNF